MYVRNIGGGVRAKCSPQGLVVTVYNLTYLATFLHASMVMDLEFRKYLRCYDDRSNRREI